MEPDIERGGWDADVPPPGDEDAPPDVDADRRCGGLRTLAENEQRQIRTSGSPLPAGVAFGQDEQGKWRRLS